MTAGELLFVRAKGALLVNLVMLFMYARSWDSSRNVHICGAVILTYALCISIARWRRRLRLPLRFQASPLLFTIACLCALVSHKYVYLSFKF